MLTPEEKVFIQYWEQNRTRQKKIFRQFLIGIPIGLLFAIPIVINFSAGWDKRADMEANSNHFNPMVLLIALLLIVAFTAIFYRQHRWDQYEQRYLELLARQTDPEAHQDGAEDPIVKDVSAVEKD
jgi:sterol desaturase/sphingolipid hydroxylase (fatty acid hydroxylase superfamily)